MTIYIIVTTSNYLELEGAVGALVMSSWKHCLALSGSSKVISEALPEPGIRNSSSRSSLQYQGPTAAAQRCTGHPEAVASTELRKRGVRSTLTHYALQASPGVGPRRCTAEMLRASETFKMGSELLGMVEGTERPGPRGQEQPGEQKYSQQRTGEKKVILIS